MLLLTCFAGSDELNCQCKQHHTDTVRGQRGQDPFWEFPHFSKFASCITMATEESCSLVSANEGGRKGKYSCLLGLQESKTACSWEQQGGEGQNLPQSPVWFSGGFPLMRGSFDQFRWGFSSHHVVSYRDACAEWDKPLHWTVSQMLASSPAKFGI